MRLNNFPNLIGSNQANYGLDFRVNVTILVQRPIGGEGMDEKRLFILTYGETVRTKS
jgi:hypothetical protein